MKNKILFALFVIVITGVSILATWVVLAAVLPYLLAILFGAFDAGGTYVTGLMSIGYSFFLAPLGLIPAYFISMKLASFLREKYGWPLRHPRRLFLLALAIPILVLALTAQF